VLAADLAPGAEAHWVWGAGPVEAGDWGCVVLFFYIYIWGFYRRKRAKMRGKWSKNGRKRTGIEGERAKIGLKLIRKGRKMGEKMILKNDE
jgi:hypothetical protein